jgi:hypothetical protein
MRGKRSEIAQGAIPEKKGGEKKGADERKKVRESKG